MTEPAETRSVAEEAAQWRDDVLTGDDAAAPEPAEPEAEPAEDAEPDAAPEPEAGAEGATDSAADAEPEPRAEPDIDADQPEPTDAEPDAQPTSSGPADLKPFRFRVDNTDIDVPGAFTTSDGHVVMSADAFQRYIRPRLVNDRLALVKQAREEGERRAKENIKLDDHPEVARARRIVEHVKELSRRGPEAVAEWAEQFVAQLPVLEARTEAELWKRRASEFENGQRQRTETESRERLAQQQDVSLRHYVDRALETPDLQRFGLDAERVLRRVRNDVRTFIAAPRDYPDRGVRAGDPVINFGILREVIEDEITRRSAVANGDAKKIERNKAALAPKKKVAPVVSTSGAGQGRAKRVEKEPTNAAEWREWVMNS